MVKWVAKNNNLLELIRKDLFFSYSGGGTISSHLSNDDVSAKYVIISLKRETPKYFGEIDVLREDMLIGEGEIPTLYLYIIEKPIKNIFPAELAHYHYIAEYLGDKFGELAADIFISKNKEKLDKLAGQFQTIPKLLGSGVDGSVYSIGPDRVLKLFTSEFSFKKSLEAIKSLHTNLPMAKTEAMVYESGILGYVKNQPIYYYIMEKMDPVLNPDSGLSTQSVDAIGYIASEIAKIIKNNFIDKINTMRKIIRKEELSQKSKDILKRNINLISRQIFSSLHKNEIIDLYKETVDKDKILRNNWLFFLIEEIVVKVITGRGDLHMGNIGVNSQGFLRYFDPAHELFETRINL